MFLLNNLYEYDEFITTVFVMASAESDSHFKKWSDYKKQLSLNHPTDYPVLVLIRGSRITPVLDDLLFLTEEKLQQIFNRDL